MTLFDWLLLALVLLNGATFVVTVTEAFAKPRDRARPPALGGR